ncbi:SusC/RagA family TonB-linked outer membrane protein [Pedobacter sp. HMF7647]|uniref:SusC/RagA family TonB-linked outer membrane protein n=1 Tax=Hufsiella arboris TaxID=2695275 RepID=A0A7K1Y688_9SPHI|nr:TonB-dependent receptor [Hufsiella arboris]MXV50096.1 SusC/RagA family TonB-linked outer membrane protein [Hufsiella arboris]
MKEKITYLFNAALLICFLVCTSNVVKAQTNQFTVSGTVVDEKGNPLPGASIKAAGQTRGTSSDANGKFSITLSNASTLTITYVGMAPKTVDVTSASKSLNIILNDSGKQLNEVVVVGYGTQKRSDVTGAVVSVPKQRLSQIPVTNVLQAVEGAVAGVNITTTSSVPGSQPAALIRGQNSITANSGPYIVVDGVPFSKQGGTLNDINPNDIASIEVLKDPSAVAIYGTNGSQGVILITTKKGATGKPVIRYNGYVGTENLAHILEPRNGAEYVQKYADYMSQTGQTQTNPVPNYGELPNYNAGITTDWVKEATQQGIMQDHNLSISGGTEDVKYYVSGEYMDQKGAVRGYQYKRVSFRTNLDANLASFLSVGTNLFVANNNRDGGRANLLFATSMSPYGQEYNPNGTYAIYPMNPEQLYTNPLLGLVTDRLDRGTNLNGNLYADVKFGGALKGLKYRINAGYTYLPYRTASYTGREANDMIGTASNYNEETNSYTLENILSYNRDWKDHHLDVTALYSNQESKFRSTTAGATGFVNDQLGYDNLGAGATQTSNSYQRRRALVSQMARVNYSYKSRYLLTLTARRDGSSVFGADADKYGLFPSAAIGWNISNEDFMRKLTWIDNLKIRGSYGKSGNEAVDVYGTISTDNTARSPFNGISTIGTIPSNLGNSNLHWEETVGGNVGVDFSVFNSRINGSVDMYDLNTSGLLLRRSLPIITGYANVLDNIGKTANKGIEVSLNTRNFVKGDFKWETAVVFATNKNKIVDLYGDKQSDLGNRWFIGQPINVVYDYVMQGVWQTGQDASKQDPGSKAGDLKFADVNGDGKVTADDRVVLGQTAPKWTGGLTNTFHYKNINLNVFIQTVQGVTKSNPDLNYGDETGRRNTPAEIGYWTSTNGNNTRPALSYNNTRGYGYASDASFTRIKDVTLSYQFNPKVLDKLHLGGLTIYASGRNLYTFTDWIGWDPENNYLGRGITSGSNSWVDNYPTVRTFVFGANISLK